MGTVDLSAGESACGMPVSVQIARLERELASRLTEGFVVENTDLYSLEGTERDAALDAVVAGEPSPFVLMRGRLVCAGAVDTVAVLDALLASPVSAIGSKVEHVEIHQGRA
jgi:hypothetical protein